MDRRRHSYEADIATAWDRQGVVGQERVPDNGREDKVRWGEGIWWWEEGVHGGERRTNKWEGDEKQVGKGTWWSEKGANCMKKRVEAGGKVTMCMVGGGGIGVGNKAIAR